MDCSPPGSSVHGDSLGKNTGVGCHALLQGIFPTQGSNPGLPHCRRIPYQLSHQGSPRILEWVAYPFSRGSSQPENWTGVSNNADGFFTNWATWEAQSLLTLQIGNYVTNLTVMTASRESSVYFFQHANCTLHLYGIKYFLKFISNFQLILRVICRSFYSHFRN